MIELLFSKCAYCNNKNINILEKSFKFKTSSVCGHQICSTCFDGPVFRSKKVVDCPAAGCGKKVKKTQYSDKSKEELDYLKERKIRKTIMSQFNLEREDFDSDEAYQRYQELAEQVVWNKLNGENLEWTNQQIEKNLKENENAINRRAAIRADADRKFKEELKEEMERQREELRETIEREREELELRRLEKQEGNLVALGERKLTSAAARREKKKREEREARERAAIQQGYGPQILDFQNQLNLWPPAYLEGQPKKQPTTDTKAYRNMPPKQLRDARRTAAGVDKQAATHRTLQLMSIDLF